MLILDGNAVRADILARLKPRIEMLDRPPGLAVVLVGHDPASEIYVRGKIKACADLGIYSEKLTPPETISTEELLAMVDELNQRPEIDGDSGSDAAAAAHRFAAHPGIGGAG